MNEKLTQILELYNRIIEERMAFVSRRSDCESFSIILLHPVSDSSLSLPDAPPPQASSSQYVPTSYSASSQWGSQPQAPQPLTPSSFQQAPPSHGYQQTYAPPAPAPSYANPNAAPTTSAPAGSGYYAPQQSQTSQQLQTRQQADQYGGQFHNPNATPASSNSGYNPGYAAAGYSAPQPHQYPPTQNQYPPMQNQYASPSSLLIDL